MVLTGLERKALFGRAWGDSIFWPEKWAEDSAEIGCTRNMSGCLVLNNWFSSDGFGPEMAPCETRLETFLAFQ